MQVGGDSRFDRACSDAEVPHELWFLDTCNRSLIELPFVCARSSVVEHSAFNRLVVRPNRTGRKIFLH